MLQTLSSYQGCDGGRSQRGAAAGSEAPPTHIHLFLKNIFDLLKKLFFLTQSQVWRHFQAPFYFVWMVFENKDVIDTACTCALQFSISHKCAMTLFIMPADQVAAL